MNTLLRKGGPWRIRRLGPQQGQSLAEFALVLPILLLVFMGIFDFGRMMFIYSQLSNGAREGARIGSLVGLGTYSPTNPQYVDCDAIRAAVRNTQAVATFLSDSDIVIQYDNGQTVKTNANGTEMRCNSLASRPTYDKIVMGDRVRVTVKNQFSFATPLLRDFAGPFNIEFTSARTILKGGTDVGAVGK